MRFRGKLTHQSVKVYALEKNENSVNQSRWGFILSMEREKFSSRLGFILISAGCAIGLGNVWRFPYIVGAYGGAAFVLIYLAFLLILGLPIVVMEFAVGRASKRSAALSFNMLEPKGTKWHLTRYAAMAGNYMLMMFYTTVAGWMIYYFIKMLRGDFTGLDSDAVAGEFTNMLGNPALMTGFMIFVVVLCFGICAQGLVAGVERITKVMMVCLLFLMMALAVHSMVLKGGAPGLEFYLKPDFGKMVDAGLGNSIFAAMGQSFFTLSIGIGALAIFGSYIGKERRLTGEAISITILDTLVAFMAGLIIFPACFAYGVEPTSGPSLIFITLPNVFQQAFSGVPILAYIFSVMFYALLAMAALTSTISLHEVVTAYLHEEFKLSRGKAARLVTGGCIFLGIFCSLSLGVMKGFTVFGLGMFDLFDFVTAKIMLPLGGMCISIFTGWYLDKKIVWSEITNDGSLKIPVYKLIIFILKYIAPVAISLIFINELGLIKL